MCNCVGVVGNVSAVSTFLACMYMYEYVIFCANIEYSVARKVETVCLGHFLKR